MRSVLTYLLAILTFVQAFAYNDHRGHNLDSLEREVGRWTPTAIDQASEDELVTLNRAYRDLMLGYSALNGEKCVFYAYKALSISQPRGWEEANADACRYIGQCFWAAEQYDSSMVYYRKALAAVERMEGGASSPTNPDGYSQPDIDDTRSALYGAIGNLYNMMDSIPQAMEWYAKAGAIFDQYGWNQSNAILYYNIGETWMEQGDHRKAARAYEKALGYASGDSLMVAMAQKGLGRVYMEEGKTWKALRYLHKADEYFSSHDIVLLLVADLLTGKKLRRSRKEQAEVSSVLEEAIGEMTPAPKRKAPGLSEREKEILDLLSKGYTTPQIAGGLGLSPETIKWYRKKLLVKFDVANTAELVTMAKEYGII